MFYQFLLLKIFITLSVIHHHEDDETGDTVIFVTQIHNNISLTVDKSAQQVGFWADGIRRSILISKNIHDTLIKDKYMYSISRLQNVNKYAAVQSFTHYSNKQESQNVLFYLFTKERTRLSGSNTSLFVFSSCLGISSYNIAK